MVLTSLDSLVAGHPPATEVDSAVVRAGIPRDHVFVVLDDDPTGTQSVADVPVITDWSVQSLAWGIQQRRRAVYVLTNSRSVDPEEAERRNREIAENAFRAAEDVGCTIEFVSRGDSTLRGHFPLEPLVLAQQVLGHTGESIDGIVLVPAFPEAGRITVDGVHYAGSSSDGFTPVGDTEFARDATFGYRSSLLAQWVEETTDGKISASEVLTINLADLRTNLPSVVATLLRAESAQPIAVDIVHEADMLRLAVALQEARAGGGRYLYRVGPPFVRALIGQDPPSPLHRTELDALYGSHSSRATARGGLVVVGSHVSGTTRQLDALRRRHPHVELTIEVDRVLGDRRDSHLSALIDAALAALPHGNVVISTSRHVVTGQGARDSLAIARAVSAAVVELVDRVVAACVPRFVLAKGGITSSDVAIHALKIERAIVRGPLLPGIVSLWEPVSGPAHGVPYIVFAGNVGGPESLADVIEKVSA